MNEEQIVSYLKHLEHIEMLMQGGIFLLVVISILLTQILMEVRKGLWTKKE